MTVLLTSEGVERLARAHGTAQYGGYYGYGMPASAAARTVWWRRLLRRGDSPAPDTDGAAPGPRRRSTDLPPDNVSGLRTLSQRRNVPGLPGDPDREGQEAAGTAPRGARDDLPPRRRQRG